MGKPNLFLVGAQKSGTTAMYEYLKVHPQIFMSTPKEIHYFAHDHPNLHIVGNITDYLKLFKASNGYPVIGEGSTTYLSSGVAIQEIYQFNPEAKIVVMLRNPIEMVQSLHSHQLFYFEEDEPDFEKAWRLQEIRRSGQFIPKGCRDPYYIQYAAVGKIGEQTERLLDVFPHQQVMFILFDNFKSSTKLVYDNLISFLGLPSDGRVEFPPVYETRRHTRFTWLARYLVKPPQFVMRVKNRLGIHNTGILAGIAQHLTAKERRNPLAPGFYAELANEFRPDIQKLSQILGRDLSHWLELPANN